MHIIDTRRYISEEEQRDLFYLEGNLLVRLKNQKRTTQALVEKWDAHLYKCEKRVFTTHALGESRIVRLAVSISSSGLDIKAEFSKASWENRKSLLSAIHAKFGREDRVINIFSTRLNSFFTGLDVIEFELKTKDLAITDSYNMVYSTKQKEDLPMDPNDPPRYNENDRVEIVDWVEDGIDLEGHKGTVVGVTRIDYSGPLATRRIYDPTTMEPFKYLYEVYLDGAIGPDFLYDYRFQKAS